MPVRKDSPGLGMRSWRYAMVVKDRVIEHPFVEPGFGDDVGDDPFEVSDADTVLAWLDGLKAPSGRPPRSDFVG